MKTTDLYTLESRIREITEDVWRMMIREPQGEHHSLLKSVFVELKSSKDKITRSILGFDET